MPEFNLIPINRVQDRNVSIKLPLNTLVVPVLKKLKAENKYIVSDDALSYPVVPTLDKTTGKQRLSSTGNPLFHLDPEIRRAVTGFQDTIQVQFINFLNDKPQDIETTESKSIESKS